MSVAVGIDVGGTKIAAAVVDDAGTIVARDRRPSAADEPEQIVDTVVDMVTDLIRDHPVTGVGLAVAGFLDHAAGVVRFAPNIAWRDVPVGPQVAERIGLPVLLENDANAAAWGEFVFGPARDIDDMVFVTVGTGLGGGVVNDGRLVRGAHGIGGEIGHIRLVPDGHRCGCGNRGCWEAYGSGTALVREARDLVASGSPLAKALSEACGGKPKKLTGPQVTQAAVEGDPASIELLADVGRWLGEGAADVAAILDPAMFVVGGGLSEAGDLLLGPAVASYRRNLTGRGHRPEAAFELAALGQDAGVIGAATLALAAASNPALAGTATPFPTRSRTPAAQAPAQP